MREPKIAPALCTITDYISKMTHWVYSGWFLGLMHYYRIQLNQHIIFKLYRGVVQQPQQEQGMPS